MALARAHLEVAPASGRSGGLDAETRQCVGCHDGTVAGEARIRSRAGTWAEPHPVGIAYGRGADLRPASMLPAAIRLADGHVGCGSCHSPYSGAEAMLSVDPRHGELCLSCHAK